MSRATSSFDPTAVLPRSAAVGVRPDGRRRIVVTSQLGIRPDGTLEEGLEAQMCRAWLNLFDTMKAAGFDKRHLVKTTVCVTEGGKLQLFRSVRDRMLEGHRAASSYLHVSALGRPGLLVEIEGEAVKD
jgi:2-iminobutanoate/2-iminopropanoate deaminase